MKTKNKSFGDFGKGMGDAFVVGDQDINWISTAYPNPTPEITQKMNEIFSYFAKAPYPMAYDRTWTGPKNIRIMQGPLWGESIYPSEADIPTYFPTYYNLRQAYNFTTKTYSGDVIKTEYPFRITKGISWQGYYSLVGLKEIINSRLTTLVTSADFEYNRICDLAKKIYDDYTNSDSYRYTLTRIAREYYQAKIFKNIEKINDSNRVLYKMVLGQVDEWNIPEIINLKNIISAREKQVQLEAERKQLYDYNKSLYNENLLKLEQLKNEGKLDIRNFDEYVTAKNNLKAYDDDLMPRVYALSGGVPLNIPNDTSADVEGRHVYSNKFDLPDYLPNYLEVTYGDPYGEGIIKANPNFNWNYDYENMPEPKKIVDYGTGVLHTSTRWVLWDKMQKAKEAFAIKLYNQYLLDKAEAEKIERENAAREAQYLKDNAEALEAIRINEENERKYQEALAEAERVKKLNEEIERQYLLDLAEKERIERENAEIDRINAENERLLNERIAYNAEIDRIVGNGY